MAKYYVESIKQPFDSQVEARAAAMRILHKLNEWVGIFDETGKLVGSCVRVDGDDFVTWSTPKYEYGYIVDKSGHIRKNYAYGVLIEPSGRTHKITKKKTTKKKTTKRK